MLISRINLCLTFKGPILVQTRDFYSSRPTRELNYPNNDVWWGSKTRTKDAFLSDLGIL